MGDRANICIREGEEKVYLYSHWGGEELYKIAHQALQKKWRWNDPAYLARIIFDVMIGDDQGKETSYGIWPKPCDNDGYPIIVIDTGKQRVYFENPDDHNTYGDREGFNYELSWTFDQFVVLDDEIIRKAYLQYNS